MEQTAEIFSPHEIRGSFTTRLTFPNFRTPEKAVPQWNVSVPPQQSIRRPGSFFKDYRNNGTGICNCV